MVINIKQDRGKVIYKGIMGNKYTDSIKSQKYGLLEVSILMVIVILMIIGTILGIGSFEGFSPTCTILYLLMISLFLLLIISILGFETNVIYEKGVTSSKTKLFDKLSGRDFHPYRNITKIGYGTTPWSDSSEFITFFENDSPAPTVRNFAKNDFKNDFFDQLVKALRQNCPNATWEKVNLLVYPRKYR